ncbi:LysR family transcriptional regulator [Limosilactobacillus fermentum]
MNINDFQGFIYIYQLRSITKAATQMHLSKPEMSKRLRSLEAELNLQLVDRTNRRALKITPAGRTFYHHALSMMEQYQAMMRDLATIRHPLTNQIKIGTIPVVGQYKITAGITRFNQQHPQLQATLLENEGDVIIEQLHQGEIDAAILRDTQSAQFDEATYYRKTLVTDQLMVIVPKNSPLANRRALDIPDLKHVQIASLPVGSGGYEPIAQLFAHHNLTPHIFFQSTHIETLISLLGYDNTVTLLFKKSITPFLNDQVVMIPVQPSFNSCLQFVFKNNTGSYQLHHLLSSVQDYLAKV